MVDFTDLKLYRSTSDLGGAITATELPSATPNNLFINVPKNELVIGEDYYKCFYIKNTHATETMANFKMWLSSKSFPLDTQLKWAWDPLSTTSTGSGGFITLDGVNDYVDLTNDATLWSQALTKFTFCFWIRPSAGWDGSDRRVIGHGIGTNGAFNVFIDPTTAGRIKLNIQNSSGTVIVADSFDITLNDDNFVACVYDSTLGSANMKIYVNSSLGNTANLTDTLNVSSALILGDSTTDFKGQIWDFRWWTNTALSGLEIDEIYDGADDASVDYWLKMDEGTGNPKDFVSNTKVGTLTNGATWSGATTGTSIISIPDKYTAPVGITEWNGISTELATTSIGDLKAGQSRPVWLWLHVNANAEARLDDNGIFTCNLTIPISGTGSGGTGGSGGSTGGNPPPTPIDYKIAIAGDWGCETATDNAIKLIKANAYNFVVGVGDNAYESSTCWINKFTTLKSIMNSAYGNHEYSETGGISPYKTFFGHSKTYFTFQFQNIFFIVMDDNETESSSAPSIQPNSTQYNFIASELARVATDPTVTWKIAVMHHPWFGNGAQHPADEAHQVEALMQLFQLNKVSFVCTGHNHHWVRSKQVSYNSSNPRLPNVVSATSPFSRTANGLIHVVSGTGGHDSGSSLYSLPDADAWAGYLNRTHNGIWEIVASNSGQTLTCSFVANDGSKFDTIVINA